DTAGRVTSSTDIHGLETQRTYNEFGELVQTRMETRDENNQTAWLITRTVYDKFGRAALSTDRYIEGTTNPIQASATEFDDFGRAVNSYRLADVDVGMVN